VKIVLRKLCEFVKRLILRRIDFGHLNIVYILKALLTGLHISAMDIYAAFNPFSLIFIVRPLFSVLFSTIRAIWWVSTTLLSDCLIWWNVKCHKKQPVISVTCWTSEWWWVKKVQSFPTPEPHGPIRRRWCPFPVDLSQTPVESAIPRIRS